MKKFPFPKDEDLPSEVAERIKQLPPVNIYRMLANVPQCLIPWTDLVRELYKSKVSPRYREIAILRQATMANSQYELHQHKFIAKANGITDEEINTICNAKKVTNLSKKENLLCEMADQLELECDLSDETLSALQEHFDVRQLSELIMITSFYCCVARVANATRVPIEKDDPLKGLDSPN